MTVPFHTYYRLHSIVLYRLNTLEMGVVMESEIELVCEFTLANGNVHKVTRSFISRFIGLPLVIDLMDIEHEIIRDNEEVITEVAWIVNGELFHSVTLKQGVRLWYKQGELFRKLEHSDSIFSGSIWLKAVNNLTVG